jgi:hypothetical protein
MGEVFSVTYHLKQETDHVMSWPISFRADWWRRVKDQYAFERREYEKA